MRSESDARAFPTLEALQALWNEIARRPLWAPPHLLRYLSLRRRMRLKLLDPDRVRVDAPKGKVNDCACCLRNCCVGRDATVLLRLRDLAVLKDLGRTDLVTRRKPAFTEAELASRPALARQVASEAWRTFPILRKTSLGACAALTSDGRCTLYPHWPLACARFPYALHADTERVFYSRRCDSFWIRPDAEGIAHRMVRAAVFTYDERIKDAILVAYAPRRLEELGLAAFIQTEDGRQARGGFDSPRDE